MENQVISQSNVFICEKYELSSDECEFKNFEHKNLKTTYDAIFKDFKSVKEAYDKLRNCEKSLWNKIL